MATPQEEIRRKLPGVVDIAYEQVIDVVLFPRLRKRVYSNNNRLLNPKRICKLRLLYRKRKLTAEN